MRNGGAVCSHIFQNGCLPALDGNKARSRYRLSEPPSHTGETVIVIRRAGEGTEPYIPGPARVGGARELRTGIPIRPRRERIPPGLVPYVSKCARWREAVRVYTRGRGSEMMP